MDVGRDERIVLRHFAVAVRAADDAAAFDPAPREEAEHRLAPVVASGGAHTHGGATVSAVVHAGGAAELAAENHQSVLQLAPLVEVFDEGADELIDLREVTFHPGLEIPVMVPTAEVDADHGRPRLDEAAGEQCRLAPGVAAVPVADAGVFAIDIEGLSGSGPGHEVERGAVKLVHRLGRPLLVRFLPHAIERAGEALAIFQAAQGDVARHDDVGDLKVRAVRVVNGFKGIVLQADVVRAEVTRTQPHAHRIRDTDVGGHTRRAGARHGRGHRADERVLLGIQQTVHTAAPGQHVVGAGEVVALVVVQRPHERELVGDLRLQREEFADLDPLDICADRLPDAADFGRGFGLEVVEVEVTGAAVEPEQDAAGVATGAVPGGSRGVCSGVFRAEQFRQAHAAHACHPDLQKAAAGLTIAVLRGVRSIGPDAEHDRLSRWGGRKAGVADEPTRRHRVCSSSMIWLVDSDDQFVPTDAICDPLTSLVRLPAQYNKSR